MTAPGRSATDLPLQTRHSAQRSRDHRNLAILGSSCQPRAL